MKFNERVKIFSFKEKKDDLAGVQREKFLRGEFWANCEYKDSKGVELMQYAQTVQLICYLRYFPDVKLSVGDIVEFRGINHTLAGLTANGEVIKLVCYENKSNC